MRRKTREGELPAGVVAVALLAPAPLALLVGVVLTQRMPLAHDAAFALGLHAIVPLDVVLTCVFCLARSPRRAAAWALGPTALMALAAWVGA